MQARRASRELSLILLGQIEEKTNKYKNADFQDIILKSVRTLLESAKEELEISVSDIVNIKEQIEEYENNHEENLKRPLDVKNIPVRLPMTDSAIKNLDILTDAGEKIVSAMEIVELGALYNNNDVKSYIEKIVSAFKAQKDDVDNIIKELALGWNMDRLFKIDKNILRIAITEIVYIKEVPHKVVIDEAIELAKKYSTDDSPSFINGILAKVVNMYV